MGVESLSGGGECNFGSTLRQSVKSSTFNVKFITPLLIGGGGKNQNGKILRDENGLSGKALRGCWRFWCRAVIGGMAPNINVKLLNQLESQIFGSADSKTGAGATFRMIIEENESNKKDSFYLGLSRSATKNGFYPACYSITIIPRNTMANDIKKMNILLATIWLWGNLGSVGNRSRKGFGSPVIYLQDIGNNPFKFEDNTEIKLPIKEQSFTDTNELKRHLEVGLCSVWKVYEQWIRANGESTVKNNIRNLQAPNSAQYFILKSFAQIAVGNRGYINGNHAVKQVHGKNGCDELGSGGSSRMASTIFIRFHDVSRNGKVEFLPIFTWCKQSGFQDEDDCARNYLAGIKSNNEDVFTNYLNGDPLCPIH